MTISELCNSTIQYITALNITSDTDSTPYERDSEAGETIENQINAMRAIRIDAQEHSLKWINMIAECSIASKVGNCVELSCLAIKYLLSLKQEITVELFSIPGQDHYFIVLNRENTNFNNPLFWNEDCIILDPLDNDYFSIKDEKYTNSRVKRLIEMSLKSKYPHGTVQRFRLDTLAKYANYEIENGLNNHIEDEYWPDFSDSSDDEDSESSNNCFRL